MIPDRKIHNLIPFYRLRWRFDFNGKPSRMSGWNSASTDPKMMAAFVDKKGLTRVSIEGEKIGEWVAKTLFECDGHLYASMEWVSAVTMPAFFSGSIKKSGDIVGIAVLTNDHKITVYIDGQIKTKKLNDYEKKFNLTEHRI